MADSPTLHEIESLEQNGEYLALLSRQIAIGKITPFIGAGMSVPFNIGTKKPRGPA